MAMLFGEIVSRHMIRLIIAGKIESVFDLPLERRRQSLNSTSQRLLHLMLNPNPHTRIDISELGHYMMTVPTSWTAPLRVEPDDIPN